MPNINSSLLALRRKRLGYEQKQIAYLLGHKTTHQICRYETGQRTPSFNEAVKLSVLYNLPIRVLFVSYFRHCREELEKAVKRLPQTSAARINLENAQNVEDYCSYLELMNSNQIAENGDGKAAQDLESKLRRHIKILIEERSKRI